MTKSLTRGGGLRIGKVITESRAVIQSAKASGETGGSIPSITGRFVDGEETRVQGEMIEILTMRLAKKEKETELLRVQQSGFDTQRNHLESKVTQLESELAETKATLAAKVEHFQRETQQAQLQIDRFRSEAESLRVSIHETKRQRERDDGLVLLKERRLEQQIDDVQRELACLRMERQRLEDRVGLSEQKLSESRVQMLASETRCTEVENALAQTQQAANQLAQQLEETRVAMLSIEAQNRKVEQEKISLEERVQQLSRSLRDLTMRANEGERRKTNLLQVETELNKQLTQLHRENEELRARNGQLQAQGKQQLTRIASLETAKASSDTKLVDMSAEVELARKRLREQLFRVQQLQDEVRFLTKKKPVSNDSTIATIETTNTAPSTQAVADGGSAPSWMLD